jgi:multiple sugar transport system ATP-binding protein
MTLSLKAITKKFGGRTILHNLDLNVGDGECVALLGPSGCGKSTALRLIAGLDQPESGSISIDGTEMNNVPAEDRRVGMVFQSYALFPHLSVRENLELGLRMRGSHGAARDQRITTILEVLQLSHQAHQRPAQLSGGQRQRVALARALLRDPLVYLLDEPMSNLDAQLREELRPELKRLMLGGSQPVVYVTHDQQEAMALGRPNCGHAPRTN